MMEEINNMKFENDGILTTNNLNIKKVKDLQLTNQLITVENGLKTESTLKSIKSTKTEKELFQNNSYNNIDLKHIVHFSDDNLHLNTIKDELLEINKKPSNYFTNAEKIVEHKINLLNNNSVKNLVPVADSDETTKFLVCCRFCRKGFKTLECFNVHDCKKKEIKSNQKVHTCKFCSLTFSVKRHLTKHMKEHKKNNCTTHNVQTTSDKALHELQRQDQVQEPKELFNCSFCNKKFSHKQSLSNHLKTHATDQYLCLECGFTCKEEVIYKKHTKEHIKISKYECHLCGKKFVRRQQHEQHRMGHEKYSCSSCDATFSTKKLFLKHQQSTHNVREEKKHACPICEKLFQRPKQLLVHQRIHTGEKPVKCSHCEKNFYDKISLSRHMKTVRHLQRVNNKEGKNIEIEKPHFCSGCGARFYRHQSLVRHIAFIHSDSKSFECPHCEYSTKCKTNLARHMELHTDTKRFICEICGSSFRAFATLKEHHAFVHSENREFICGVCNKGFKNNSALQRHMRIHSKNRPYKCHCNRDYKRMSHLKRHMIAAHHMTFKKNQIPIIKEDANLNTKLDNESVSALVEILETLSDHSSTDNFSVSGMLNSSISTELNDSNVNENINIEKLPTSIEDSSTLTNVPSSTVQTLIDNSDVCVISHDDPKSTLVTFTSNSHAKTSPICILPDTHSTVSLDDSNLNLSPNSYFNLPSSPLTSIASQDMLSFSSSSDILNRPHSLPNLNFQTHISSIDSFTNFSLQSSDSTTISSFLLNGDISSPSHITDLNLEQNNSPKQLFGDSDDILSLPPYPSSNVLEVNCSSEHFFSPPREIELWDSGDDSSRLKLSDSDLVTPSTCAKTSFSNNLSSNANNLLSHNIMFSNDSLMVCPLDAATLNSEFDALSNLC